MWEKHHFLAAEPKKLWGCDFSAHGCNLNQQKTSSALLQTCILAAETGVENCTFPGWHPHPNGSQSINSAAQQTFNESMQLRRCSASFFFFFLNTSPPKYVQAWWFGYFLVRSRMEFWICLFRGRKWVCVPHFLGECSDAYLSQSHLFQRKEKCLFVFCRAPILQVSSETDSQTEFLRK